MQEHRKDIPNGYRDADLLQHLLGNMVLCVLQLVKDQLIGIVIVKRMLGLEQSQIV